MDYIDGNPSLGISDFWVCAIYRAMVVVNSTFFRAVLMTLKWVD
jgi:hypothetical protein